MMIKLNDIEITEEQFKEIAEREGYVKEFEYPIYKKVATGGAVFKFTSLRIGVVIIPDRRSGKVGTGACVLKPHTSNYWEPWQPHEELKKQYAEDVRVTGRDARLHVTWEYKDKGQSDWHVCLMAPQWYPETQYRRKETKPKTYDGYTLEQLKQAIDEGLLCEFWDITDDWAQIAQLSRLDGDLFIASPVSLAGTTAWKHCRIHHSQPQFVIDGKKPEWLDDDTVVVVKYKNKDTRYIDKAGRFNFDGLDRFQVVAL